MSSGPEPFSDFESRSATSIVETGISTIWVQDEGETWNSFDPNDGMVKWFRDQLGQLWLKFYWIAEEHPHTTICMVYPADMCRCVEYEK